MRTDLSQPLLLLGLGLGLGLEKRDDMDASCLLDDMDAFGVLPNLP